MSVLGDLGRAAWRLWNDDGVPSTGAKAPDKADILAFVNELESTVDTIRVGTYGTSTTSLEIEEGVEKVFATQEDRSFVAGTWVLATSDSDPTGHQMAGLVTSYVDGELTVEVVAARGGGATKADWTIRSAGPPGGAGPEGASGTSRKVSARLATNGNIDLATELVAGTVIDGVTTVAGNRLAVLRQDNPAENGLYPVVSAAGSFSLIAHATSTSSGASLAATLTAAIAIGDVLIVAVAADNAGTSGVSSIGAVVDSDATNTYTAGATTTQTAGAANDGTTLKLFTCTATDAVSIGGTVTAAFSPNTTSKAIQVWKAVAPSGQTAAIVSVGAGTAQSSVTAHTAGDVTLAAGESIIVFNALETFGTVTYDSDTTRGAWSAGDRDTATAGTAATSQSLTAQWKIATAPGVQNNTLTSGSACDGAVNHVIVSGLLPARDASFQTFDSHAGIDVAVTDGEQNAGKVFTPTCSTGGTLGVTAIPFSALAPTPAAARASQPYADRGIMDTPIFYRDYAETRSCDPADRYTRASAATWVDSTGLMRQASARVPRPGDHDPTTFKPRGLTVEGARTKCTGAPTEDFSDALWVKSEATVSTNVSGYLSPLGAQTVDKLIPSTNNAGHTVYEDVTVVAASHNFYSRWFGAAGYSKVRLTVTDTTGTDGFRADLDLETGEISNVTTIGAGVPGQTLAEKWTRSGLWRFGIGGTIGSVTTVRVTTTVLDSTGAATFAGDGTSGILMWGDQPEPGQTWTSYLSPGGTPVARVRGAHQALLPTIGAEITLHFRARVRCAFGGSQTTMELLVLDDGSNSNRIAVRKPMSNGPAVLVVSGGSTLVNNDQQEFDLYAIAGDLDIEFAVAISADGQLRLIMGSDPFGYEAAVASLVVPSGLTTLRIGSGFGSTTDGYLTMERVAIFSRAMSLPELQKLVRDRDAFVDQQVQDDYELMTARPAAFAEGFGLLRGQLAALEAIKNGWHPSGRVPAQLQLDVAMVGDSQTQLAGGYLEWLAERWHGKYGGAGEGYVCLGRPNSYGIIGAARRTRVTTAASNTAHWSMGDDAQTPCRSYAESSTSGATLTVDFGQAQNRVKLFYVSTADGAITWATSDDGSSWSGETSQSLIGDGSAGNVEFVATKRYWRLTRSAGTVRLGGLAGYRDGVSGIRMHQLGNGGQGISKLYLKTQWVTQMQALLEYSTDDRPAIIMTLVSADQGALSPFLFNYEYRSVLAALYAAMPDATIGAATQMENDSDSFAGITPMTRYAWAVWAACRDATYRTPYLNLQRYYGLPTMADAARYHDRFGFAADGLHFIGADGGSPTESAAGWTMAAALEGWMLSG